MLSINTNLSSLIVQSNLSQSTNALNKAIERMTTGFKINGAKDNAANYGISTKMSSQINSYEVAEENASMGLDMVSSATGVLDQISDRLSRLRALQEQAVNGTYGDESLKAINKEVNVLVDEIERLYDTAEYNGIKLFAKAENVTRMLSKARNTESGFVNEVVKRDTIKMTALASVDLNSNLTGGTYSISTAEELAKLATMTNKSKVGAGAEFVLANDIDLSSYSNWTPIGSPNDDFVSFNAKFDGNGYTISNLISHQDSFTGLFGVLRDGAVIKNLGVENAEVVTSEDNGCVGIISAGVMGNTTIDNCYTTGKVEASCAGGIIGIHSGGKFSIKNSFSDADVTVHLFEDFACGGGGLLGSSYYIEGTSVSIDNCYTTGNITVYSEPSCSMGAGGLCGAVIADSITNSYSTSKIILQSGNAYLGAFCGIIATDDVVNVVKNCYYDSAINQGLDLYYVMNLDSDFPKSSSKGMIEGIPTKSDDNSDDIVKTINFQVGINSEKSSVIELSLDFKLTNLTNIRRIGLGGNYLNELDELIAKVSAKQVEYGAVQNRLESVLEEINIHYENLVSSRSTLRDADIAEVSSEYIRSQILQQASATLLATANQAPALALQLL